MSLRRSFVLHGPIQAKLLHAFLKSNAAEMAKQGQPLEVSVSVYKAKRSKDQNNLMWALLEQIAQQAFVGGRRFEAEVWHEHMKRELLPDETLKGVKKWRVLPSGHRDLGMGTTDLNTAEFSLYLEALQAKAASELGVEFDHMEAA